MTLPDGKSFAENISVLFDELKLAVQWNRPSILLAICKSRPSQIKAENDLKNKLQALGISVIKIEVSGHSPFVFQQILNLGNTDKIVFFISNIDWGGGPDGKDTYRNLNMDREILVENQIKAIFWLTRTEALNLPTYAPDFWAFRHQVVEFAAARSGGGIELPVGLLIWHGQNVNDAPEKIGERIETYNKFMIELPDSPESLSSRLELLYSIGYLHWVLGDTTKALELLQAGVNLAQYSELFAIQAWLMNGNAIIYYEKGEYASADGIYKTLIARRQDDGILRINFSATLSALGRNFDAISESKKAVKLGETEARIWNRQGYIYMSAGKLDEAVPIFKKAIELDPTSSALYESLAICYYLLGLKDESARQIRIAYEYAGDRLFFTELYDEAIHGRPERSLDLLRAGLVSGRVSETDIKRNFNVQIMFGGSLFES